jgi:hypothetical protein
MTKLMQYSVLREHRGDKAYAEGDVRVADPKDVQHLVGATLEEIGPAPEQKADAAPLNKAEPVLANKAAGAKPASNKTAARKPAAKAKR